ncbi:hypothetical protein PFISCL1PPCAC_22940, partial [Pristionchus fissidentatus]
SMPTDAVRLERLAAQLTFLYNGERVIPEVNPAARTVYDDYLKEIGRQDILDEAGQNLDVLLNELDKAEKQRNQTPVAGADPPASIVPSDDFFHSIGWLAYARMDELNDFDVIMHPIEELVSDKDARAKMRPVFFSWCIMLLEKLTHQMDPQATSNEFVDCVDLMENAVFFYLYEHTETLPNEMVMHCGLRIMRSCCNVTYRPKFWPIYLRIVVTRCLRTREIPFKIQELCYKLSMQASWMLGPRFWSNDEEFVRLLAALSSVHWRLMLEGLADRMPIVTTYSLFLELFTVCEERNRISDQTAICVANNCKEMLESIAGYIKGEEQNPKPLDAGQAFVVTSLMSALVATGAFHMIHADDERVIVDWWLRHAVDQSDVFRELMLCSTSIKTLDTRVLAGLAGYYERCFAGEVPEDEADLMVMHWVMKLIHEKRTDFYDKKSLSECVARLERVRTPKKYVDALKRLKC